MNHKAPRRPHGRGRATQLNVTARSRREPARARVLPGAPRLIGRWTVAADGRLVLEWAREPERSAPRLINRKRGSNA